MFICQECLDRDYENLPSPFPSRGLCEVCGKTGICSDIHHSQLVRLTPERAGKSRLDLLFEDEQDAVEAREEDSPVPQTRIMWALMRYFSELVGEAESPRIRVLFDEDMTQKVSTDELLSRVEEYHIGLIGTTKEETEAVRRLFLHRDPVFDMVRSISVQLWDSNSGVAPVVSVAMALEELAHHAGCHQTHRECVQAMLLGTVGGRARRDMASLASSPSEFIANQLGIMDGAQNWPRYWFDFVNTLIDRLESKDVLPRGGALCIHIDSNFAVGFDYFQFLRTLERMGHPRVAYLLQIREDMLRLCLTASYARRWTGAHQARLSEEAARMADHNARYDLMRYTRFYDYAPREIDPNERMEMLEP